MKDQHLYEVLLDFCVNHGAHNIKDLPGCWEFEFGEPGARWLIAVHGGSGPRKTSKGDEIPPGVFWLEWNGWPAGMVDMSGWSVVAGSVANETRLRTDLRDSRAVAKGGK